MTDKLFKYFDRKINPMWWEDEFNKQLGKGMEKRDGSDELSIEIKRFIHNTLMDETNPLWDRIKELKAKNEFLEEYTDACDKKIKELKIKLKSKCLNAS